MDTKNNKSQIDNNNLDSLDKAIDHMDMSQIDKELEELSADQPFSYSPVDSELFARSIIKKHGKGNGTMKKNKMTRWMKIAACFALITIVSVTAVYASGFIKSYWFHNETSTVQVRSSRELNNKEAEDLANDMIENNGNHNEIIIEAEDLVFNSIQEAEEKLNIQIALPTQIPTGFEMKKISSNFYTQKHFNLYVTYEKGEQYLGISLLKNVLDEGQSVVTMTDATYKDKFTLGEREFRVMDEDGGLIIATEFKDLQYALIGYGLELEEMKAMLETIEFQY